MKLDSKILLIVGLIVGMFIGTNNFALSNMPKSKIAVVDIQKVVTKSPQVIALKNDQIRKSKELARWLETTDATVKKQTNEVSKQKLIKKYKDEFAKKKETNQKLYAKKLALIESNIASTIATEAKSKGYDIVLTKSSVLYGGDDITAEILKIVK